MDDSVILPLKAKFSEFFTPAETEANSHLNIISDSNVLPSPFLKDKLISSKEYKKLNSF
jgi:hypothetical protein